MSLAWKAEAKKLRKQVKKLEELRVKDAMKRHKQREALQKFFDNLLEPLDLRVIPDFRKWK